jgi:hypothetical protein
MREPERGEVQLVIRAIGSKNHHEDPLASQRFPIRVHQSDGGRPVYARRCP